MQDIQRHSAGGKGPSQTTRPLISFNHTGTDNPDGAQFSSFHSTYIQRCIGACVLPNPRSFTLLTTSPLFYILQNPLTRPSPRFSPRTLFQMFRFLGLTVLLFTALAVRADVVPSVPGPGVVYKTGGVCHIEWNGDKSSNTIWKDMSIELMTGSNLNMIHLTSMLCFTPSRYF